MLTTNTNFTSTISYHNSLKLTVLVFLLKMCVCVCIFTYAYVCRFVPKVCTCLWRPEVEMGFFLGQSPLDALRRDVSLNLELTDLASLAKKNINSALALGMLCLSLSIAGITDVLPFLPCSYVGPGNMNYSTHACISSTFSTKPSPGYF